MRIRTRSMVILASESINQATMIILAMVLVRVIDKATFGTYRQSLLVYSFTAGLLSLDLGSSLYYFLPKLGAARRGTLLSQTFLTSLMLSAGIAVVLFAGAAPIAHRFNNPDLIPLIRILAAYPFVERLIALIPAFMISLDRPVRAGLFTIAWTVGRVGTVVSVFALGGTLPTVMTSIIVVAAVVALVGVADMVRLSWGGQFRISWKLIADQLHYAWPLWATAVVGMVNLQFGNLVISCFFDRATFAVYSCGAMDLPVIAMITYSMNTAIMPNLVNLLGENKKSEALHVWQEAMRKSSLVVFPCFAFFLVVSQDFILLMYGQEYTRAAWPFAVYLCRLPIHVAVYASLMRAAGKTKPIAIGALILVAVNVPLSTLLVWAGGGSLLSFVGPSVGAVCASFASFAYLLWMLRRILVVPLSGLLRWKELGFTLLLSVLCGMGVLVAGWVLPGWPVVVRLGVQGVVFCGLVILSMLGVGMLHRDELELLSLPIRAAKRVLGGARPRP